MENRAGERRSVVLRQERVGNDSRHLTAQLNGNGDLRLVGQDLGPGTAPVSSDGEYEWETVVPAEHLPALLRALDAPADADVLEELVTRWTGKASYEVERRIRAANIPCRFWNHGS